MKANRKAGTLVLKLGGSLITNKDVPYSVNRLALRKVSNSLKKFRAAFPSVNVVIVHGGGSFGHYAAKKFGLTRKLAKNSGLGISSTTNAMLELNLAVRSELMKSGVPTEVVLPSELISRGVNRAISPSGGRRLRECFSNGLVPVTFGFVVLSSAGSRIVSGDTLCLLIAKSLRAGRVVFAMDVDGIYRDSSLSGSIIPRIGNAKEFNSSMREFDVTGGLAAKVSIGFQMARSGAQVFFVNGKKDDRLLRIMMGKLDVIATSIGVLE